VTLPNKNASYVGLAVSVYNLYKIVAELATAQKREIETKKFNICRVSYALQDSSCGKNLSVFFLTLYNRVENRHGKSALEQIKSKHYWEKYTDGHS